jgi:hypothetical protein
LAAKCAVNLSPSPSLRFSCQLAQGTLPNTCLHEFLETHRQKFFFCFLRQLLKFLI